MTLQLSWMIKSVFILTITFYVTPIIAQIGACEIVLNNGSHLKADIHEVFETVLNVKILEADEALEQQVLNMKESVRRTAVKNEYVPISITTIKQLKTVNLDLVNQIKEKVKDTAVEYDGEDYYLIFLKSNTDLSNIHSNNAFDSFWLFMLYRLNESQSIGVNLNYYPKVFDNYFINTSFYSGIFSGRAEFQSTVFNIGVGYKVPFSNAQISVLLNYSIQHGFSGSSTTMHQDDQYRIFLGSDVQLFKIFNKLSAKIGFEYYPVSSKIIGQEGNAFSKIGIGYRFY